MTINISFNREWKKLVQQLYAYCFLLLLCFIFQQLLNRNRIKWIYMCWNKESLVSKSKKLTKEDFNRLNKTSIKTASTIDLWNYIISTMSMIFCQLMWNQNRGSLILNHFWIATETKKTIFIQIWAKTL